mgnify:CR=1 FL=1
MDYPQQNCKSITDIETLEQSLAIARARLLAVPTFNIYASSILQLEYLLAVLRGVETDRSRLKDIIVGQFAMREFEASDPELAEALFAASYIAHKTEKGSSKTGR